MTAPHDDVSGDVGDPECGDMTDSRPTDDDQTRSSAAAGSRSGTVSDTRSSSAARSPCAATASSTPATRFAGRADSVIDRPDWFICPGFINLHGHIGVEVMAAMVDHLP